ncbi:MAG TPA: hypothetical protein VFM97_00420 [Gammaproteobacteria bacterium]|nr:hypothetical protein [Gammaproteobacteria bacterium]
MILRRKRPMTPERLARLLPRAKRMGLRRWQKGDFGLLNAIEEQACRMAAKQGELFPDGIERGDADYAIDVFMKSPLGKVYGIKWRQGVECDDCYGEGETECSECGHEGMCQTCLGEGVVGIDDDRPMYVQTDLGGFPLGLH